ncbi:MAG: hypothetical protein IJT50_11225 [Lentisphaeria bacterium]|nr:hypothetical protein [Lentisphaeria bacterium]
MKCAKCGNDVPDDAVGCPNCAAGAKPVTEQSPRQEERMEEEPLRCPLCGGTHIRAVSRIYNPGCGCLGLLLFSWVGLLLGLLGAGGVDMVCADCGARWPAGRPGSASRGGCMLLLVIGVLILLSAKLIF